MRLFKLSIKKDLYHHRISLFLLILYFLFATFFSVFYANEVYAVHKKHGHRTHITKKSVRHHKKTRRSHRRVFMSENDLKTVSTTARPISFSVSKNYLLDSAKINTNKVQVQPYTDPRDDLNNSTSAFKTPFGQVSWPEVSAHLFTENGKVYSYYKGYKLQLTLDPQMQAASAKYLHQANIINGSTAIIEPKTGRILALSQSEGSKNADIAVNSTAPAASLIKIVTAAAAIEKRNLNPDDMISFRGGCGHLQGNNWLIDPRRDRQKVSLANAFGRSCNTVFARLALYDVGLSSLKDYAEKFMFNKPIPSDLNLQTSMFLLPEPDSATPQEVAEAGAGFGASKLNPVHAALLSATINNHGVMMAPYLIEAAFNSQGVEVYRGKPIEIGRVISDKTAAKIEILMLATTSVGSGRRVFHRKGTRFDLDEIGGKTGTLLDPENRNILYTWFSGVASLNTPNSIAIGTFIASSQNWVVRASSIAQTTLADFLRLEKMALR